jgi:hypothetical protein
VPSGSSRRASPGGSARPARLLSTLEQAVIAEHGVVLRYGQLYGPGTYFPDRVPDEPRVSLDRAAIRTVEAIDIPSGIYTVTD